MNNSEQKKQETLNIGVIGAGGFAEFSVKSFLKVAGVNIIAITDINESAAIKMVNEMNTLVYKNISDMLENENIDLIYIATPPFLHYHQSKMALLSGKHVICEKPAALQLAEAKELASLAKSKDLLYVVNLMQRYNPVYEIVNKIIKGEILGNFLHGFFENYASDENLDADHWFWDETKSGGIFIEHGVHFFDMFSGWLGKGDVINALQIQRPCAEKIVDRVHATVIYKDGIVNFYHGFDQPKILDRQEMRLLFERGEITLYGWIPVKMKLHGLLNLKHIQFLQRLLEGAEITYNDDEHTENKKVKGRFHDIIFDREITFQYGDISEKQNRYQQLLTGMLTDQWKWVKDHSHKRIIDETNAVESLRMAEQGTKLSKIF
ncbi:MAG TPA: Gfo/Idh/MocA family oxidoreductase [Hanamia sp.]|nr:Gfo/Idh/MocA family oxidoreductase [Hanamia sp.]